MEYAACAIAIAISPGTMKTSYSTPSIWRMRPPSDSPKTTMNRNDASTGATIVCDQSLSTRSVSRAASAMQPAVAIEQGGHRFEASSCPAGRQILRGLLKLTVSRIRRPR